MLNRLDLPVCTFPVTLADKTLDLKRTRFHPLNELDRAIQGNYDAEVYHGGPVGLQMVGRRLEEEKVLEMTRVVSKVLREG
jgi:amidase